MRAPAGAAVIGIGNDFRRDDGAGWAVVALLRRRAAGRPLPPHTVLEECDGDPGRLMGLWEDADLAVVVDACFPRPAYPGRIHRWCLGPGEVLHSPAAGPHSTHGLGLVETLRLAGSLGRRPGRVVVYAVEGADHSLGTGLTPSVAEAVRRLAPSVEADVARHGEPAARGLPIA